MHDQIMHECSLGKRDAIMASYLSASRFSARFKLLDVPEMVARVVFLSLPSESIRPAELRVGQVTVSRWRWDMTLAASFLALPVALLMGLIWGRSLRRSTGSCSGN